MNVLRSSDVTSFVLKNLTLRSGKPSPALPRPAGVAVGRVARPIWSREPTEGGGVSPAPSGRDV